MIIPVRCFTCNKVIGHLWEKYQAMIADSSEINVRNDALNSLGLNKYCCRRMFLGHVDVIDELLLYSNNPGEQGGELNQEYMSKAMDAMPEEYAGGKELRDSEGPEGTDEEIEYTEGTDDDVEGTDEEIEYIDDDTSD